MQIGLKSLTDASPANGQPPYLQHTGVERLCFNTVLDRLSRLGELENGEPKKFDAEIASS